MKRSIQYTARPASRPVSGHTGPVCDYRYQAYSLPSTPRGNGADGRTWAEKILYLDAHYDVLAFAEARLYADAHYDLNAFAERKTWLDGHCDLLSFSIAHSFLDGHYDVNAFAETSAFLDAHYDVLSFTPSTLYLDGRFDLNTYAERTHYLNAHYDLLSFRETVGYLDGHYDVNSYRAVITHLDAHYDLNARIGMTGYLDAHYDVLAYTPKTFFLDAHYDALAFAAKTTFLDAHYDVNAYAEIKTWIDGNYDIAVYQGVTNWLDAHYDLLANAVFYGWAINLSNGAVSKYEAFNFNSISPRYACGDDGIYSLGGTSDNGAIINGLVQTGKLDWKTSQLKRVTDYYHSQDGGKLTLSVTSDNTTTAITYTTAATTKEATQKLNLARGAKGRYWQFKLANVAGSAARVSDPEIIIEPLSRKI